MWNYLWVSVVTGVLFGILDGLINANPVARRLYEAFEPIARDSLNAVAGLLIDLLYGFALAGLFLLLYRSLPGDPGWLKGLSLGAIVWFFRVLMSVASQWMMFRVPLATLGYTLLAGLAEMLIIGFFIGLTLKHGVSQSPDPRRKVTLRA